MDKETFENEKKNKINECNEFIDKFKNAFEASDNIVTQLGLLPQILGWHARKKHLIFYTYDDYKRAQQHLVDEKK